MIQNNLKLVTGTFLTCSEGISSHCYSILSSFSLNVYLSVESATFFQLDSFTSRLVFVPAGPTRCQRAEARSLLSGWMKGSDITSAYHPQCEQVRNQNQSAMTRVVVSCRFLFKCLKDKTFRNIQLADFSHLVKNTKIQMKIETEGINFNVAGSGEPAMWLMSESYKFLQQKNNYFCQNSGFFGT